MIVGFVALTIFVRLLDLTYCAPKDTACAMNLPKNSFFLRPYEHRLLQLDFAFHSQRCFDQHKIVLLYSVIKRYATRYVKIRVYWSGQAQVSKLYPRDLFPYLSIQSSPYSNEYCLHLPFS